MCFTLPLLLLLLPKIWSVWAKLSRAYEKFTLHKTLLIGSYLVIKLVYWVIYEGLDIKLGKTFLFQPECFRIEFEIKFEALKSNAVNVMSVFRVFWVMLLFTLAALYFAQIQFTSITVCKNWVPSIITKSPTVGPPANKVTQNYRCTSSIWNQNLFEIVPSLSEVQIDDSSLASNSVSKVWWLTSCCPVTRTSTWRSARCLSRQLLMCCHPLHPQNNWHHANYLGDWFIFGVTP